MKIKILKFNVLMV